MHVSRFFNQVLSLLFSHIKKIKRISKCQAASYYDKKHPPTSTAVKYIVKRPVVAVAVATEMVVNGIK